MNVESRTLVSKDSVNLQKIEYIFSNAAFVTELEEEFVYIKGSSIEIPCFVSINDEYTIKI